MRVLGPFEAVVDGAAVDLGGPRQRAVLALLLVARGDVVSVDRIVDDLWNGEPPPRATGALQAYVSHLRRVLEPRREPRAPARLLVSVPPGYAVRLPVDAVDAWRFEDLARRAAAAGPGAQARALLEEGLSLWRGPAYAEVAHEPWALPEVTRLEELRIVARERLAEARLATGAAPEAVLDAEALTREHPLREEGWRLLALALHACGRQGDALGTLRRARRLLADELGLDPGPALAELESRILAQDVDLPVRRAVPVAATPRPADAPVATLPAQRSAPPAGPGFVGREGDLALLGRAADGASPAAPAVALVAGEAGSGKSALLDRFRQDLGARGWRVVLGRCPEAEGAPPAWAWVEALRELAAVADPGPLAAEVAPLLADAGRTALGSGGGDALTDRFRLHRSVARWLAGGDAPVAVVLDDLHRGDDETLALLRSLLELWPGAGSPVLVVAAYRPGEGSVAFEETLAALARRSPARVELGGLSRDEAARLVAAVCGREPDSETVQALALRTGGNPFYLRESARLLASEGALVATSEVPQGVRDILRRRFARLPEVAVSVLRLAAVQGRDVDVDVLLAAAEADEDTVLDALEVGVVSGLLVEAGPGALRFSHVLVRDALYGDIPGPRRARWHGRLTRALEELRPGDLAALAHHHAHSVSAATAARAVDVSVRAGELAEARYAYDAAMDLYGQAVALMDRVPPGSGRGDDAERVAVLGRLVRAALRRGATVAATRARDEALAVALRSGDDALVVEALCAWREPVPWSTKPYGTVDRVLVRTVERLLASPVPDDAQRVTLLYLLVRETYGEPGNAGRQHAERAVAIARTLDDPLLLGLALCAAIEVTSLDDEPEVRQGHAQELLDLAQSHGLVQFEAIAHTGLRSVACTFNDPAEAERHLRAEVALVERYQFGQIQDVAQMCRGFLAMVRGRFDEAAELYLAAGRSMARRGSVDAAAIEALGLTFTQLAQPERLPGLLPRVEGLLASYGPFVRDMVALALARAGEAERAAAVRATYPPLPPREDFFAVLFVTVRAAAAAATGDRADAAALYPVLLPYADRFAGSSTAAYAFCPVASVLAECAELLGDLEAARRHQLEAAAVGRAWDPGGFWERRALEAAERLSDSVRQP